MVIKWESSHPFGHGKLHQDIVYLCWLFCQSRDCNFLYCLSVNIYKVCHLNMFHYASSLWAVVFISPLRNYPLWCYYYHHIHNEFHTLNHERHKNGYISWLSQFGLLIQAWWAYYVCLSQFLQVQNINEKILTFNKLGRLERRCSTNY